MFLYSGDAYSAPLAYLKFERGIRYSYFSNVRVYPAYTINFTTGYVTHQPQRQKMNAKDKSKVQTPCTTLNY